MSFTDDLICGKQQRTEDVIAVKKGDAFIILDQ